MSDENDCAALVEVPFKGGALYARQDGERVLVATKEISDRLGLDWPSQLKRIKRNPILRSSVVMMTIETPAGPRATIGLPLQYLNGWLFGIDVERVKPEAREMVLAYQREGYQALFEWFYPQQPRGRVTLADLQALIDSRLEVMSASLEARMGVAFLDCLKSRPARQMFYAISRDAAGEGDGETRAQMRDEVRPR